MSLTQKLFGFHGRLSRLDWWVFGIALNIVGAALTAIISAAVLRPGLTYQGSETAPAQLVGLAVTGLLIWPSVALTVKRRHDCDRVGWMSAALFLVLVFLNSFPLLYVILPVVAFEKGGWWGVLFFFVAVLALWILLLILLGLVPGTKGPNRFGPSPLEEAPVP